MTRFLFAVVLGAVLIGGGVYAANYYWPKASSAPDDQMKLYDVVQGDMLVTVTEDGNVESAENVEIKCQVAGGSSILWIIQDGSEVKEGDKIVELDKAQLEEQINTQRITFERARSAVTQAEKDYSVAQIAVKEYLEGTYKKSVQDADATITIAMENLRSAQNSLDYSNRMFRKGYVSSLDLESAQFAVQRAQLELDSARTAKDVLDKFTKVKMLEDLESKVATALAKMNSEKAAFNLEDGRLKRLEAQIANCAITAPAGGMVVFANDASRSRMGGQQGPQIEEGAQVRERQTLLRIPNLQKMQVKVAVHETKVESIRRGMRARIKIQDREVQGTVESIANQPEPGNFFSSSVKKYATIVKIGGESTGLKPGMTAEVEILVDHLKDVLTLPVACIVEDQGKHFCWVAMDGQPERRALVLGKTNDQFVEVKDGVAVGDQVIRNPRAVVAAANQSSTETSGESEPADASARFGKDSPGARESGKGPGAGGPAAGGPAAGGPGAGGPGAGGPGAGGPGGPGGRPGGLDMTQLDKDGDGKLSKEEVPAFMQSFFDRVDSNADGFLDAAEMTAMRNRAGGRGAGGGGMGNLMSFDKDGDGKVSPEELPEPMRPMFERMDANADGFIDQAEIDGMRDKLRSGGGGGGFGPGGGGPPPQ